jgi:hypothetical protein
LFKDILTFADIDTQLSSYSDPSGVISYLDWIVNSAWIIKNYCLANGSDQYSEWIYRYTSWIKGLNYDWDTTNSTIAISDQSQQAFGTTIMWNNSDWWYHK